MARLTLGLGVILIILGVGAYFGTGQSSWTALIPAIIGALFVILGAIALNPRMRKHAMHGAVILAFIGMLGSLMRPVRAMLSDAGLDLNTAVAVQFVTAGLCLIFIVLAIRSFAHARTSPAAQ